MQLKKTQDYLETNGKKIPVEIEVRNWEELEQVIKTGWADKIMLDNFTPTETKKAVDYIKSFGGINFETIRLCRMWSRLYFYR